MKVNIAIAFNDVIPPKNIGMVPGGKPSYYNQLLCLVNSIKKSWDTSLIDYSIHVFHSRDLHSDKKSKLESLGCEVIHDKRETTEYLCRENVFDHELDGDYTLLLDTDMIVLKTPDLDFEKDIYVRTEPTPHQIRGQDIEKVSSILGTKDKRNLHFNTGCVLIRNSMKSKFYELFKENIKCLEFLNNNNRHMGIQSYLSLLIQCFDWGLFDKGVNVFSRELSSSDMSGVSILHYLGINGFTPTVDKIISTYR